MAVKPTLIPFEHVDPRKLDVEDVDAFRRWVEKVRVSYRADQTGAPVIFHQETMIWRIRQCDDEIIEFEGQPKSPDEVLTTLIRVDTLIGLIEIENVRNDSRPFPPGYKKRFALRNL